MSLIRSILAITVVTLAFAASSVPAFANTLSVTNQIKVTATIKPARHVIVNADDKILQIISNTSEPNVEPTIYRGSAKPEFIIATTNEISEDINTILATTILKPGILYDSRTDKVPPIKSELSKPTVNIWLSGIFNLKNVNPTVNLTRL